MNTSRENLDIQRAIQVIAQADARADFDGVLNVVFATDEEILSGYVAYEGQPVVMFRKTTGDWPPEDEISEGEDVPPSTVGVWEPERTKKSFWPLEEYIERFDPDDYGTMPDESGYLPLRLL